MLALLLLAGCKLESKPDSSIRFNNDSLQTAFAKYCGQKDADFKSDPSSPLLPEDKAIFKNLEYFEYDSAWRFKGPLIQHQPPDSTTILGSKEGDIRPALKYGYFELSINGQIHRLQVIKILPRKAGQSDYLFFGFRDQTNDDETYGGGRYIELEPLADGDFIVDFNYAYNPYCAYNHRYSCAIPPLENTLPVKVSAGEKIFKKH